MSPTDEPPIDSHPICPGGRAEPVNADASRCPLCDYVFTNVLRDPTAVPPHWVVSDVE